MVDVPTGGELDGEVLTAALEAVDAGLPLSKESLLERFPGKRAAVEDVIRKLASYEEMMVAERDLAAMPPRDGVLARGTRLGEFTVLELIGKGGFGAVYRARRSGDGGREVALKVLSLNQRDRGSHSKLLARFHRETRLAAGIHHPNFAEILGSGSEGDLHYFAMRLVEGRTLDDVLRSMARKRDAGAATVEERGYVRAVVGLVRQVAHALAEIHERGLVHRDVKPSNIVLEGAGPNDFDALTSRPVLVDYGLLRSIDVQGESMEVTGSKTLIGTPAFLAPEAHLGRDVDARADVFSLGVVLHDLLTLTCPGTRRMAAAGMIPVGTLNPAVDRRLAAIVSTALEDRRAVRYPDGGVLARDLGRYLAGQSLTALPRNPLSRMRQFARREPTRAAKLSGLSLLVFVPFLWISARVFQAHASVMALERLEAQGLLLEAASSADRVLEDRALVAWLPWLRNDLRRAELYRDLLVERRTPVVGTSAVDESLLRRLHTKITDRILEGASPEDIGSLLQLLLVELEKNKRPREGRRLEDLRPVLAAESLCVLLGARPTLHSVEADELWRAHYEDLQRVLGGIATSDDEYADRETKVFVVAGLSGVTSYKVFALLIDCIGHPDEEVSRVATAGSIRLWWRLKRLDGAFTTVDQRALLSQWAHQVIEHPVDTERYTAGNRLSDEALDAAAYSLSGSCTAPEPASEGRRLGGADRELPALAALVEQFASQRQARGGSQPSSSGTTLSRIDRAIEKFEGPSPYEYDYEVDPAGTVHSPSHNTSAWFQLQPDVVESNALFQGTFIPSSREERERAGQPGEAPLTALVDWQGGEYLFVGSGEPVLEFLPRGRKGFSVTCDVPRDYEETIVTLDHAHAARWYLPFGGRARIRIVVNDEYVVGEFEAPLGRLELPFRIDRYRLRGREQLKVDVEIVGATSAYWLYGVDLEFRSHGS